MTPEELRTMLEALRSLSGSAQQAMLWWCVAQVVPYVLGWGVVGAALWGGYRLIVRQMSTNKLISQYPDEWGRCSPPYNWPKIYEEHAEMKREREVLVGRMAQTLNAIEEKFLKEKA